MSLCLGGQGLAFTFFVASGWLLRPLCCPESNAEGLQSLQVRCWLPLPLCSSYPEVKRHSFL